MRGRNGEVIMRGRKGRSSCEGGRGGHHEREE